ncbi:hypothetical protein Belba_3441 [Belliella baltica DSM 15883]|uniref:DUF4920 domain-containing protein n=1 Tax=Belliella baltica (strain DSM 15883 / CIP 108006 / LMG 21964 / BA134) TaxID=866536 RepID=I3Z9M5_BELBD|nr:DUF4920 domain-containing protein [Belliella baltica]AFL85943.1 hypothetical protein Belba_3441 [Belliella baltica DSM 15883]
MKSKFLLILMLPIFFACNNSTKVESEPIEGSVTAQVPGNYGAVVEEVEVLSISQMYDELASKGEFEGKVIGQIKEVCSKKGCWMTLDLPNGETMRVTFKDYGFFVPLTSQGYPVIIEGIATKSETDVATLKHYAEDAGKSKEEIDAITAPKLEYAFEAVGVIIKENA